MIAKQRRLPHFDHSLRPRYRWDGRTLPFKPPNAALPHVLDKIRHECDEAGTTRPCVCERGVYQGVTGTTEDEFAWVQLREARLLSLQPPVGDALQAGEIFQRFMVRSE